MTLEVNGYTDCDADSLVEQAIIVHGEARDSKNEQRARHGGAYSERYLTGTELGTKKRRRVLSYREAFTTEEGREGTHRQSAVHDIADQKVDTTKTQQTYCTRRRHTNHNERKTYDSESPRRCAFPGHSPPEHRTLKLFPYESPSARSRPGAT